MALPHGAATPDDVWSAWTLAPLVTAPLATLGWIYAVGQRRLRERRSETPPAARYFWAGYAALLVALVSPIDALGEALFSAHMVQHMTLVLVAAPLLVLGRPVEVGLWALRADRRRSALAAWDRLGLRRAFSLLAWGPVAWALHAGALWVWHVPLLYEAALHSEVVHAVEHASFLGTAVLFWWGPVHAATRGRRGHAAAILFVFTTALQAGALGALITFAGIAWYPAHGPGAEAWGVPLLRDQQIAGLVMWLPGGLVYLAAAGALLVGLLRGAEARARLREGRDAPRFRTLIILLGLSTWSCLAQGEIVREAFETVEEARAAGLFDRGWMPDVLPAGSGPIVGVHDLDTNAHCSRAGFPVAAQAEVAAALRGAGFVPHAGELPDVPLPQCPFSLQEVRDAPDPLRRGGGSTGPPEIAIVSADGVLYLWSGR